MQSDLKMILTALDEGQLDTVRDILTDLINATEPSISEDTSPTTICGSVNNTEYRRRDALQVALQVGGFNKTHDLISNASLIEAYMRGDSCANS